MDGENIAVTEGILVVRSKSGSFKIHKVLVNAKVGNRKSYVKCRFQEIVEKKKLPSRIPVLIKNYKTRLKRKKSLKTLYSSRKFKTYDSDTEKVSLIPRYVGDHKKYTKTTSTNNVKGERSENVKFLPELDDPEETEEDSESHHQHSGNFEEKEDYNEENKNQNNDEHSDTESQQAEDEIEEQNIDSENPDYNDNESEEDDNLTVEENCPGVRTEHRDSGVDSLVMTTDNSDRDIIQEHHLASSNLQQSETEIEKEHDEAIEEQENDTTKHMEMKTGSEIDFLANAPEYDDDFDEEEVDYDDYEMQDEEVPFPSIEEVNEDYEEPYEEVHKREKPLRPFLTIWEDKVEEDFKIYTPTNSSKSYMLDNEVLLTGPPSPLSGKTGTEKTNETITDDTENVDDGTTVDFDKTKYKKRFLQQPEHFKMKHTIVMSQYERTPLPSSGIFLTDDSSETRQDEEFLRDIRSDESMEYRRRYIDSGLRPHKSDESRLYLDPYMYRRKKPVRMSSHEDVEPLLEDIPSSIFHKTREPKKAEDDDIKPSISDITKESSTSSEDIKSDDRELSKIDSGPLKKLKEFEDIKFTIDTGEGKKDDICIHTKDAPDDDNFSSTTADETKQTCLCPSEQKDKSIFSYRKETCIHTVDPPESDYSQDSSINLKSTKPSAVTCVKKSSSVITVHFKTCSKSTCKKYTDRSNEKPSRGDTPKQIRKKEPKEDIPAYAGVTRAEPNLVDEKEEASVEEEIFSTEPVDKKEETTAEEEIFLKQTDGHLNQLETIPEPADEPMQIKVRKDNLTHLSKLREASKHSTKSISPSTTTATSTSPPSVSSLLLESNKERRRSRYQKIGSKESMQAGFLSKHTFHSKRFSFSSNFSSYTPSTSSTNLHVEKKRKRSRSMKKRVVKREKDMSTSSTNRD